MAAHRVSGATVAARGAAHVVNWPHRAGAEARPRSHQGRHDGWGPDSLVHMSGWPARVVRGPPAGVVVGPGRPGDKLVVVGASGPTQRQPGRFGPEGKGRRGEKGKRFSLVPYEAQGSLRRWSAGPRGSLAT